MNTSNVTLRPNRILRTLRTILSERPELMVFAVLLAILNIPTLTGSFSQSLIFLPEAVKHGQWWRLFTHPFVHVTWYHLLLDGTAFLMLYHGLVEQRLLRRLGYVLAGGAGGLLISWVGSPAIATNGLCGLSGIAHGLMAVSALEMVAAHPVHSTERRLGMITFMLVVGKALFEALTGKMFFTFLHFGLMGLPVAISHASGIIGSLTAMFLLSKQWKGRGDDARLKLSTSLANNTGDLDNAGRTAGNNPMARTRVMLYGSRPWGKSAKPTCGVSLRTPNFPGVVAIRGTDF